MSINDLYRYLPDNNLDWDLICSELLKPFTEDLKKTNQEFKWHQEGNVLIHTKMVVETLINLHEYKILSKNEQLILFIAALFHDIGKPVCTKIIDNEIVSPNHGIKGSLIFREYFWKELGVAGSYEYQEFREAIALLIRYHSIPIHEYNDIKRKVINISANQILIRSFSIKLLTILAKADVIGRIGSNIEYQLLCIDEFINTAIELDCFDKPFNFSDNYSRFNYLKGNIEWPYMKLYDDTWSEVILMCGLPGTGKDTFIKKYYSHLKVISLDDIREEYKLFSKDDQGEVLNIAKERAKEYLRNKIPFIWNATSITKDLRSKQLDLFHKYNAKVKIIYLETSYQNILDRNSGRNRYVNVDVIDNMLKKFNIPAIDEAIDIEYICL